MYAYAYSAISSQLVYDVSSEVSFGVDVLMEINISRCLHFRFMDENSLVSPSPTMQKHVTTGYIACNDTANRTVH